MPRYYFHLISQGLLHEDLEGIEVADLHAALDEALRAERELSIEPAGIYDLEFAITDSSGRTLLKVPVQGRQQASSSVHIPVMPHVGTSSPPVGSLKRLH